MRVTGTKPMVCGLDPGVSKLAREIATGTVYSYGLLTPARIHIDRAMNMHDQPSSIPWIRKMVGRDPEDRQRGVSPLELFFDLCFAAAIAQTTAQFGSGLAAGSAVGAILGYFTVFFAIWWAWMNFTWFASAFDNDDVPCRMLTLVQIAGALILAAGTARAFHTQDFTIVFVGYAVMRIGLIALWLRTAHADPTYRRTALRYALGLAVAMAGWSLMALSGHWPLVAWAFMAMVELAVPPMAETAGRTPWNRYHIARRYGRFMIIVLGQSVVAATGAVQAAFNVHSITGPLVIVPASGLLLVFALWWLYFTAPAERVLMSNRQAFLWGYGHYAVFASTAALGAGLSMNVEQALDPEHLAQPTAAAAVAVPVAVFLCCLWAVHIRPHRTGRLHAAAFATAVLLVLASIVSPWPLPALAMLVALLAAVSTAMIQTRGRGA